MRQPTDCPADWGLELWRHRQQNPDRPWIRLAGVWEKYPPGQPIPEDWRKYENHWRRLAGLPERPAAQDQTQADQQAVLGGMGCTSDASDTRRSG